MSIKVLGASAPKWANEEKTAISLMVKFSHLPGKDVPFTATKGDGEEHGRELWSRAIFGDFGKVGPFDGPSEKQLAMMTFPARKAKALEAMEKKIAPLERAQRLKMATPEEVAELAALERHTVELMRAEGPEVPAFNFAH